MNNIFIFLLQIIFFVLCIFFAKTSAKKSSISIAVKNNAETVEGTIRMLMIKHPFSEITITDCGSTDDTAAIIQKLCRDYEFIHTESLIKY